MRSPENFQLVLPFQPGQVILAMNDRLMHFHLSPEDYGQMVDGLIARQEAWSKTAAWHRGEISDPYFQIEESTDEREAQWIADRYAEILKTLREQAALQQRK